MKKLESVKWPAEFLGLSTATVYAMAVKGEIPCIRIGGSVRFDPDVVEAWVKEQAMAGGQTPRVPVSPKGAKANA